MALWLAETGLSATRAFILTTLLSQLLDPNWPRHLDYVYSPDFMNISVTTFVDGIERKIPSACDAGPSGELPEFEYLVVGSGPGGSVVAHRLAKKFPTQTVVLIEAGPEASVNVVVPAFFIFGSESKGAQTYHANVNPNYANAFRNGMKCDVGRELGGSTNLNAMLFPCGVADDYNYWANLTGDPSWNEESMRQHVKNIMNMNDKSLSEDEECSKFYGTEGEVFLGPYFSDEVPTIELLKHSAIERGYRALKDINCGKWTGYLRQRGTIKNGERFTAANAYLAPLRDQKNLLILQNAVVDKITTEDDGSQKIKVKGVRVVTKNEKCPSFELRAKKEVILSAGAFNTPLILQRSGIGRSADLEKFGIKQLLDLNVGHNYRDHFVSLHTILLPAETQNFKGQKEEIEKYFTTRKGTLSYLNSADFNVFFNVDDPSSNKPTNQWIFFTFAKQQNELKQILEVNTEFKDEYVKQVLEANENFALIFVLNTLSLPKSSGQVKIRSTNPFDEPEIDGNYLSEEEDVNTMVKAIRELESFVNTSAMKNVGAQLAKFNIQECDSIEYASDDYWECYMKYFTQNEWHPSGTARMGRKNDSDAVVDNRLKVRGVTGRPRLRISDASVMPQVPSTNTQCVVYALADKAAKMIIEDNQ